MATEGPRPAKAPGTGLWPRFPCRRENSRESLAFSGDSRQNRPEKPTYSARFQRNSLHERAGTFLGRSGNSNSLFRQMQGQLAPEMIKISRSMNEATRARGVRGEGNRRPCDSRFAGTGDVRHRPRPDRPLQPGWRRHRSDGLGGHRRTAGRSALPAERERNFSIVVRLTPREQGSVDAIRSVRCQSRRKRLHPDPAERGRPNLPTLGSLHDLSAMFHALIGGVFALAFTRTRFSVYAAIGFISLFGMSVIKRAIILSHLTRRVEFGLARGRARRCGQGASSPRHDDKHRACVGSRPPPFLLRRRRPGPAVGRNRCRGRRPFLAAPDPGRVARSIDAFLLQGRRSESVVAHAETNSRRTGPPGAEGRDDWIRSSWPQSEAAALQKATCLNLLACSVNAISTGSRSMLLAP